MSYILDALRKSEERRKQKQADSSSLRSARIGSRSERTRKRRIGGLILTGCMLLVFILLGAGWWWSTHKASETHTAEPAEPLSEQISEPQPEQIKYTELNETKDDPDIVPPLPDAKISVPKNEPAAPHPAVVDFSDLPAEAQARIVEMIFSGHVYSPTPSLRMIMIDNVVVREGGRAAPDLTIVEITEQGLIMELGTMRFRMDLF